MSADEIARRVEALGHPMNRTIVANIENHRRSELTIDEVLVFALALNVAPTDLILPRRWGEAERDAGLDAKRPVHLTDKVKSPAGFVRTWLEGSGALLDDADEEQFVRKAPSWVRRQQRVGLQPQIMAVRTLEMALRDSILTPENKVSPRQMAKLLRTSLDRVRQHVEFLAEELDNRKDWDR